MKQDISSIKINNIICTDPKEIADHFNEFFTSIADVISDEIHPTVRPPESDIGADSQIRFFDCSDIGITCNEIQETVKTLKSKKSEDFNGLSMYFIKSILDVIIIPLTHVFNRSFSEGIVPSQLKIAKIIPIFKAGDPLLMDNYRPISLLSTFSKILEKIMCNRLVKFLDSNSIISKEQFGFRKNHSTIHPIIQL